MDDGRRDFDFLIGEWRVTHRRLRRRLAGCTEWEESHGTLSQRSLLGGLCNGGEHLTEPPGVSGVAIRTFDPAKRVWSIYWVGQDGLLGLPVHGGFADGVGVFEGEDEHDGRPVKVRFRWTRDGPDKARWEQAFSADGGASWEVNWAMDFVRAA
ncbi:DUF1579 domain-containing protein [Sphingosinicella sp.]|uniref:DUF1579 domain-containing protein n=1 Tax=Sphingosinicella sp. TaxID=1917971 RepID=UPI004037C44E